MKDLNELIAKCVLAGVMFEGQLGSQAYSIQDLIHSAGLKTLNNMWKRAKKELSALETDSLFKSPSNTKKNRLQLKVDAISSIFEYKQEQADKAEQRARNAQERAKRLDILKTLKTEKEMEQMGKLSLADLDKEIADLETA